MHNIPLPPMLGLLTSQATLLASAAYLSAATHGAGRDAGQHPRDPLALFLKGGHPGVATASRGPSALTGGPLPPRTLQTCLLYTSPSPRD
eukprot:14183664-Alexandrium_andersonii.AAC.1